jgi:hypothetical protein
MITATRSFEGWTPCQEGGAAECAQMRMSSAFDPASLEAYRLRVTSGQAKSPLAVQEEIIGVVLHPDGAWPTSAILRKRTTTLHPVPGHPTPTLGSAEEQQSRTLTLDWTLPAGPLPQ